MNKKIESKLGSITIWTLSLLPLLIWLIVRSGTPMFRNYDVFTHSLGQVAGLVGMAMFSLTFLLSTRLKSLEKYFGGLDKMYGLHHNFGVIAFVLVLFHPLLLVLNYVPSNIKQATIYLLPSSNWAVNFGIIALLGLILLIALTIFAKIKYQNWKFTHEFMGLVLVIALYHIFFVTTDITFYPVLRYYMMLISGLGLVSYIYSLVFRKNIYSIKFKLKNIEPLGNNIALITLSPINNKLKFKPGQFAFLSFPNDKVLKEQHPFTITSSPTEQDIVFAVKSLGDYTSHMKNLKSGEIAEIEGPYGGFSLPDENEQVWIAGGIGITPFLSLAKQLQHSNSNKKIDLFYCTKTREEAVFLPKLQELSKKIKNLKIIPYHSDEKGRINTKIIEQETASLKNKSFLLCGPHSMMHTISEQLKEHGVAKDNIIFENFNIK